ATALGLVVVVDQVLVVGVGVYGFDVAVLDAELLVDHVQRRRDRVGGAARRGNDLVFRGDLVIVDAEHDVLQIALAGRSQDDLGNARALEVFRQAFAVAPLAGVVDDDSAVDVIGGVVDRLGVAAGADLIIV